MAAPLQSIAVWSPKGGVGKSVLSVALALKLAEQQPTVLVDGNADNPDLASVLQCPGSPNVAGWVVPDELSKVETLLVHHSNHLWVLPGPPRYVDEGSLSGPVMESVINTCTLAAMSVVVDLGTTLRDSTVAALDRVDRILIPVTLDLLSLVPLKRLSKELDLLRLPHSKFRVVINRHTNTPEITADDILAFSPFPVIGVLPSARELAAAVNRGEVGAALAGNSVVGRAVEKLVHSLFDLPGTPEPEQRQHRGGLFGGRRKGGS